MIKNHVNTYQIHLKGCNFSSGGLMSAELMKLKFARRPLSVARRPSVCPPVASIILHLKTPLLQMEAEVEGFQTFPEFSSKWSSQNYVGDV